MERWLRAGILTGIIDAMFSSVLNRVFYGSTVTRLWQGVASVPLGRTALDGGTRTAAIGLAIHFGVALTWTGVFLLLSRWTAVRRMINSRSGVLIAASLYGPLIWLAMSFGVIPLFTRRLPAITFRWWVQFFGHIPFVAVPIVASIASPFDLRQEK